jgi:hypothetical protein
VNKLLNVLLDPGMFRSWDGSPASFGGRCSTFEVFRFRTVPRTAYPCSSKSRMQNPAAGQVAGCR